VSPILRGRRRFLGEGVALTFDDGPDPEITPRVLSILGDAGATATFFVTGERALAHPELLAAMRGGGHQLGNHTQTHANLLLTSPWRTSTEIALCQKSVSAASGVSPRVFRAPWGKLTPAARLACRHLGLAAYDWTVAPEGWPAPETADRIARLTLDAAAPGAIVDLHDVTWHSSAGPRVIEALPAILSGLAALGLATVTLPGVQDAGPVG
jgi:peptidoglycan-N-acetylglucosamine deacetylase